MPKAAKTMAWGSPKLAKQRLAASGIAAMAAIPADASQALARAARNSIAVMIGVPFQNNMNFGYGSNHHIQNLLNIQSIAPFGMNEQQPLDVLVGAYPKANSPDIGTEWQLRFQIQFLFRR
ncbi:MAG: hypothetical protein ING82_00845 [Roseomonas sp.]|nr:hypothetical protein [Roseomonas sp.]